MAIKSREYAVAELPSVAEIGAHYYIPVGNNLEHYVGTSGGFKKVANNTGSSARYTHLQAIPALVWTVNHNLGFKPVVIVMDSSDRSIITEVEHIDNNTLKINNDAVFGGKVYCA